MNIKNFLKELLFYFPMTKKMENEELERLFSAYTDDILYEISKWNGYNCDFQILLREIRSNYPYEKYPSIATIINYLPRAKVLAPPKKTADEGCLIRIILEDDKYYDFIVVNFDTKTTLNGIKKRFEFEDDYGKKRTKIKKIIRYPKETTLIGDKVFFNVTLPDADKMTETEQQKAIEIKEKELEKQVRILFSA